MPAATCYRCGVKHRSPALFFHLTASSIVRYIFSAPMHRLRTLRPLVFDKGGGAIGSLSNSREYGDSRGGMYMCCHWGISGCNSRNKLLPRGDSLALYILRRDCTAVEKPTSGLMRGGGLEASRRICISTHRTLPLIHTQTTFNTSLCPNHPSMLDFTWDFHTKLEICDILRAPRRPRGNTVRALPYSIALESSHLHWTFGSQFMSP